MLYILNKLKHQIKYFKCFFKLLKETFAKGNIDKL